ncbi:MAG: hypothetical protein IJR47_01180 [Clostridia bacterium]|nr:hypothetical protein [Clostridia bacterium]
MKKDLHSAFGGNAKGTENIDLNSSEANDIKRIYNEYAGKSESELREKLLQMTSKGKADGSLNNETIDNMANKIAPMLDPEKRARLNSIIAMMKK